MFTSFCLGHFDVYIRQEWCSNSEARSEACDALTRWVSSVQLEAKSLREFSFRRTAKRGTVSCLSQDYPIITWEDGFSPSWCAQGSIACAGFGEQLGQLLSGTLALKRSFRSLRVPRRECIDFPLAVLATHPSSVNNNIINKYIYINNIITIEYYQI